ncbi:MAG: metallophosphoesterase [Gammaproteobacteria bacterium]
MGQMLSELRSLPHQNTGDTFPLLASDSIRWHHPLPPKIVAIGDLHGDLVACAALCLKLGLINADGHWSGGDSHLVLMGDLVGGHKDSRLLLNMVMRLEQEALAQGGMVHALLGNHDLSPIQGLLHGMSRKEKMQYQDFPGPEDAFRGTTCYAEWIRTRNSILRLGDWLFAHAGLDTWALATEPCRINATIRAWVRFWQDAGPKPPANTYWVVATEDSAREHKLRPGPLWNRSLRVKLKKQKYYHCPSDQPLDPQALDAALLGWQAKRLVVGHCPIESGEILMHHPLYREKIVMVDTRISAADGSLSALCITSEEVTPLYLKSREPGRAIRTVEKKLADRQPRYGGLVRPSRSS